jgi:hypothetical protein
LIVAGMCPMRSGVGAFQPCRAGASDHERQARERTPTGGPPSCGSEGWRKGQRLSATQYPRPDRNESAVERAQCRHRIVAVAGDRRSDRLPPGRPRRPRPRARRRAVRTPAAHRLVSWSPSGVLEKPPQSSRSRSQARARGRKLASTGEHRRAQASTGEHRRRTQSAIFSAFSAVSAVAFVFVFSTFGTIRHGPALSAADGLSGRKYARQ